MKITIWLKKCVLTVIVGFLAFWIGSIIKCELNTYKYKEELIHIENFTEKGKFKVLYCNGTYAYVYWANESLGHTLSYIKDENGEWHFVRWEWCIWSYQGNADEFIWPYIR